MPFSFANIFTLLSSAPTLIAEGEQVVAAVTSDVQALLTQPAVVQLEALFAQYFTHTTTPGSAVVTEPIAPPKGK